MKKFWLRIKNAFSSFVNAFKTTDVTVVHEADFGDLLIAIGESEAARLGRTKCFVCGKELTFETIGALFRKGSHYYFLCDDYNCLSEFLEK